MHLSAPSPCTALCKLVVAALALAGGPACGDAGSGDGGRGDSSGAVEDSGTQDGSSGVHADDTGSASDGAESGGVDGSGGADSSGDGSTGTTGGGPGCPAIPSCDAPPPNPGPNMPWQDSQSYLVAASGGPTHRGRDMFYNPGDEQWVLAKFAYGATDWDLEGERVDLFLLRDCGDDWEALGSIDTTYESNPHATVEGVEDTGGRVYFSIPAASALGLGRHRVHMIVRGDGTSADAFIEIVEPGTPIVVSDIDGTLTTYETEEFVALLSGATPDVNPHAPEALAALVAHGYRPMYLTARPEFLGARTQEFVVERGLPPGIVHTTLNFTGALGSAATGYKLAELTELAARGLVPSWGFGNTSSDGDAYEAASIAPVDHRVFFQYDDTHGGRRIEDYAELVAEFEALPDVCMP